MHLGSRPCCRRCRVQTSCQKTLSRGPGTTLLILLPWDTWDIRQLQGECLQARRTAVLVAVEALAVWLPTRAGHDRTDPGASPPGHGGVQEQPVPFPVQTS